MVFVFVTNVALSTLKYERYAHGGVPFMFNVFLAPTPIQKACPMDMLFVFGVFLDHPSTL